MVFPFSGVEVNPLIPPLIALVVSTFTAMGGVSGGFLLLPFQVSILNFTSPAAPLNQSVANLRPFPGAAWGSSFLPRVYAALNSSMLTDGYPIMVKTLVI